MQLFGFNLKREPLAVRYDDLISRLREEIRLDFHFLGHFVSIKPDEYLEHCVGRCIFEIGVNDRCTKFMPKFGEPLSSWSVRPDIPSRIKDLHAFVKAEFEAKYKQLEAEHKEKRDKAARAELDEEIASLNSSLEGNKDLIDRFFEIAERKISVLDDYGDEHWGELPSLALTCLKKIAAREKAPIDWDEFEKGGRASPLPYGALYCSLVEDFKKYHEQQKSKPHEEINVEELSGVEFEVYIAKRMRAAGFEVAGTPATGDQGADLIANKSGRKYIIQAKRYQGTVGNKAVQEVISALSFYGGDEGWVITSSTFTPSAVALAQKAHIKLIDGFDLRTVFQNKSEQY